MPPGLDYMGFELQPFLLVVVVIVKERDLPWTRLPALCELLLRLVITSIGRRCQYAFLHSLRVSAHASIATGRTMMLNRTTPLIAMRTGKGEEIQEVSSVGY